ncbi:hypothetical protein [Runella zeae]|uniref:hypothetical protein n=1 Tax=Runella zeae TaxID=94255 RepID=UPI0004901DD1|nr:hypothetical protein [Runella zeae]
MKPIRFQEVNKVYAENQPEYTPLPVFAKDNQEGEVVSCWKLSILERIRLLITGKLWVSLYTFHQPLTPSYFTTIKSELISCGVWYIHRNVRIEARGRKTKTMYIMKYRVKFLGRMIWTRVADVCTNPDERGLVLTVGTVEALLDSRREASRQRRDYIGLLRNSNTYPTWP